MVDMKIDILKQLPSVDFLLKNEKIMSLTKQYSKQLVKHSIQKSLIKLRKEVLDERQRIPLTKREIEERILVYLQEDLPPKIKRVINATGTILHTNLGRSILSLEVKRQLSDIAFHYSNLEFNLFTGKRGSRYSHLIEIIKILTGAEDALVVNNNAAAVLLVLNTFAKNKEIIVSRGELVEIGGMFRIPSVIEQSGGRIHEVGTTNKTYSSDYLQAINENTAVLLKVHPSNYRMIGFTETVANEKLAKIARKNALPFVNDIGSGLFIDMRVFGLPYEPTVKEVLSQGCDVVTFSGDKLLGGPQAGIIVGQKKYISEVKKNQLLRALRVDKMCLTALEATLRLYLDEIAVVKQIPVLQMVALTEEECKSRADRLALFLKEANVLAEVKVQFDNNVIGGGAYPEYELASYAVTLRPQKITTEKMENILRQLPIPIITRIKNDQIYLEVRTISEEELPIVGQSLRKVLT